MKNKVLQYPRNIVFSPHVDDEVIGCFLALNRGIITDVVYFYDLTDDRKVEAIKSSERFGFRAHFCLTDWGMPYLNSELEVTLSDKDTIFCPTVRDTHNEHALVNKYARQIKSRYGVDLVFYTVDMESFQVPLSPENRAEKKAALAELFPTQSFLLQNEKYHLFEGYSEKDHVESVRFNKGDVKVVMKGYNPPSDIDAPKKDELDVDYLNRLIANHYNRMSVNHIAIYRGNKSVEFNG